jgi:hypothetical protein
MSKIKKHYVNNAEFVELLKDFEELSDNTTRWFEKIGSRKKEIDISTGTDEEIAERIFLGQLKDEQKDAFRDRKTLEFDRKLVRESTETCEERNQRLKKVERLKNKIGRVFISIAMGILKKPNLINYDYFRKSAMVSDACLFMWSYIDRFDTEFSNPFSYFTQAANSAFMQNIKKEKKKSKMFTPLSYIDNINSDESEGEF